MAADVDVAARDIMKGCYVLILALEDEQTVPIGRWGPLQFLAGHYAYVGSALGGLEARIGRHLRNKKRLRWHIDVLLKMAVIEEVVWAETSQQVECRMARFLSHRFPSVAHFGCSDCRCRSHLFWSPESGQLEVVAWAAMVSCGLCPKTSLSAFKKSLT